MKIHSEEYRRIAASMLEPGKAAFLLGGQWGSEAKGAAAAWVANELAQTDHCFDIVTTNAGAQAGHTSIHDGIKRVVFHLPTASLISRTYFRDYGLMYLNAGSIIDPEGLEREIDENKITSSHLFIHPMAAVITDECREAEGAADSMQTRTASTRKGVGQALSRKVLRSGLVAKDHPFLSKYVRRIDLNKEMLRGKSVLVEVPQGVSLSLNHSPFYPHTTSRDCTVMSGMSDAGIHPEFLGKTMVVLRTYPIRVGNIVENGETIGFSGDSYGDQEETSWEALGVEAEITTVTKRVRRVFTFSEEQIVNTFSLCRPDIVFLSFCNYAADKRRMGAIVTSIRRAALRCHIDPHVIFQWGATTEDVSPMPL